MHDIILNNKPKYKFVIENFEGPLDLLLYLISTDNICLAKSICCIYS